MSKKVNKTLSLSSKIFESVEEDRQGKVEEERPGNTLRELASEMAALFPQRDLSLHVLPKQYVPIFHRQPCTVKS